MTKLFGVRVDVEMLFDVINLHFDYFIPVEVIGDGGLADGDFINGGGEGFSAKLGELGWGGI